MCVLKVNGLLSGGQSHCSCSTAQKDSTTQTQTGGVEDYKEETNCVIHCDFILLLLFIHNDRML